MVGRGEQASGGQDLLRALVLLEGCLHGPAHELAATALPGDRVKPLYQFSLHFYVHTHVQRTAHTAVGVLGNTPTIARDPTTWLG